MNRIDGPEMDGQGSGFEGIAAARGVVGHWRLEQEERRCDRHCPCLNGKLCAITRWLCRSYRRLFL